MFFLLFFWSFGFVFGGEDLFFVWFGLEMNMISFLTLIYGANVFNLENMMKYFFVQAVGSVVLLTLFFLRPGFSVPLVLAVLFYKSGVGPFYSWFVGICQGVSWVSCYLLMVFQSVLPFFLMSFFHDNLLWLGGGVSLFVGSMGGLNSLGLKGVLAFSSIHHAGWVLVLFLSSGFGWFIYFLVYAFLLGGLFSYFIVGGQMDVLMMGGSEKGFGFILNLLSLGGIPPLLGFWLKWWVFKEFVFSNYLVLGMMVLSSVVMCYVYVRVVYFYVLSGWVSVGWGWEEKVGVLVLGDVFTAVGVVGGFMLLGGFVVLESSTM